MKDDYSKGASSGSIESVSATFSHDISTPVSTIRLNVELLNEYQALIDSALASEAASDMPEHIKQAISQSPQVITNNIQNIEASLNAYKDFLNALGSGNNTTEHVKQLPLNKNLVSLKILLVDDERIHHDIAEAVLGESHQLFHEYRGKAAIDRCYTESFDVILMDMQMPEMTGPQTTKELVNVFQTPTLIIGLTNMPIQSQKPELLACGFNGFLDKPLKRENFESLVKTLTQTP